MPWGSSLVRVAMYGGSDPALQVMAERPDTRQLNLERLRRAVAAHLRRARRRRPDRGGVPAGGFFAGIDRPLTRLADFDDGGYEARIRLVEPIEGRKQFDVILTGI